MHRKVLKDEHVILQQVGMLVLAVTALSHGKTVRPRKLVWSATGWHQLRSLQSFMKLHQKLSLKKLR